MNISRLYLVIGSLYLIVGIFLGMYMGAHQDFTLAPVHAHINLLGFTLMTLFGIAYRVFPSLAGNALATVHFWLHQLGVLVTLVALFLLLSGTWPGVEPILAAAEGVVFLGVLVWLVNLLRNLT